MVGRRWGVDLVSWTGRQNRHQYLIYWLIWVMKPTGEIYTFYMLSLHTVWLHLYAVWLHLHVVWLHLHAVWLYLHAVWLHLHAVWLHLHVVWLHLHAVWLHLHAVWLHLLTVWLHLHSVWLHLLTVWLHLHSVWLRLQTSPVSAYSPPILCYSDSDKSELDGTGPSCPNCNSTSKSVTDPRSGALCTPCYEVSCINLKYFCGYSIDGKSLKFGVASFWPCSPSFLCPASIV